MPYTWLPRNTDILASIPRANNSMSIRSSMVNSSPGGRCHFYHAWWKPHLKKIQEVVLCKTSRLEKRSKSCWKSHALNLSDFHKPLDILNIRNRPRFPEIQAVQAKLSYTKYSYQMYQHLPKKINHSCRYIIPFPMDSYGILSKPRLSHQHLHWCDPTTGPCENPPHVDHPRAWRKLSNDPNESKMLGKLHGKNGWEWVAHQNSLGGFGLGIYGMFY